VALAPHTASGDSVPLLARPVPARASRLLFAVAVLLLLGYTCWYFNNVEDDVFITLQYALNFCRGHGWVMNPGERVEGYTSPLHLWLLTLTVRFLSPDGAVFLSKAAGVLIGIQVLANTRRIARLVYPDLPWLAEIAMLLLAARPEFTLSMTNAMETGLAVWLLTGGVLSFLRAEAARSEGETYTVPVTTVLWFVGAALTRPELFPMLPVLLMVRSRQISEGAFLRALAVYLLPLTLFLAFRIGYYHDILPNTYYAKHVFPPEAFGLGLIYYGQYALPSAIVVECVPIAIFGLRALHSLGRHRAVIFTVLGLNLLFILASGGTYSMDGRFVAPVMPLLALIWAGPLVLLADFVARGQLAAPATGRQRMVAYLVFLAVVEFPLRAVIIGGTEFLQTLPQTLLHTPQAPLDRWKCASPDGRRKISNWIAAHARPGQTVAQTEMGIVSVLNPDIRLLDLRGLTDRTVARLPDHHHSIVGINDAGDWCDPNGQLWPYIRQRRPEWVILFDTPNAGDRAPLINDLYVPDDAFEISGDIHDTWRVRTWRRKDVAPPPQKGAGAKKTEGLIGY